MDNSSSSYNFGAFRKELHLPNDLLYHHRKVIHLLFAWVVILGIIYAIYKGFSIVFILLPASLIYVPYFKYLGKKRYNHRIMQVRQFALDNGITFNEESDYIPDGVISDVGRILTTRELLEFSKENLVIKMYIYSFVVGYGKRETIYQYGLVEIDFEKNLPHIFIDSKENNKLGAELLNIFKGSNMVELEGDFQKFYRIYIAQEYEIEALTILDPVFMQKLIELKAAYEIEMVDNRVMVYLKGIDRMNERTIKNLISALDFVIQNLAKNLTTFKFTVHPENPNNIEQSFIKKIMTNV